MSRPIWKGYVSFGLVAIPINLYPVEKKNELSFHLLDSRDKSRIRYERINAETGKEVPWEEVVKAYEFQKGNYVVLKEEDFERAAPEAFKTIDIEEFVNLKEISHIYFDRPYYVVPDSANQKAYVLLREALKKTGKVGVAKVVIRTKQYLSLIIPQDNALILNLIRFNQEIRSLSEFDLPTEDLKKYKIQPRELQMAITLINDMSAKWSPDKYHDEYRDALMKWIKAKTKSKQITTKEPTEIVKKEDDVIDFMSLLKKSIQHKTKSKASNEEDVTPKTKKKQSKKS